MRVLFALLALAVTVSAQGLTGPEFWIAGNNGTNSYLFSINGALVEDPALTLNVGTTYKFIINATMDIHPFGFTTATTAAVSNFSSPALGGVTTSGLCTVHTDNLSWKSENLTNPCVVSITPAAAQAGTVFYYRCALHASMNGALTVPPAATQSPSTTPPTNSTPAPTPTPTTPPKGGDAACIVPGAIAMLCVAINALFSA